MYQSGRASILELTLQSYEQAFGDRIYPQLYQPLRGKVDPDPYGDKGALRGWDSIGWEEASGRFYERLSTTRRHTGYVKECIAKGTALLNEKIIKDIHVTVDGEYLCGGIYRNVDVYISEAQHTSAIS